MEIKDFITEFEKQFDEVKEGDLSADTELESIDEWGSLQSLVIISMIDAKYHVKVSGDEINNAKTVGDIFRLVERRANSDK